MKKKVIRRSSIQLVCRQAKPGAALSFLKNMVLFCKRFNDETKNMNGPVNVEIVIYSDNSYEYTIKNQPTTSLIKEILDKRKDVKFFTSEDFDLIISKTKSSFNSFEKEKIKKIIEGTMKSFNKINS